MCSDHHSDHHNDHHSDHHNDHHNDHYIKWQTWKGLEYISVKFYKKARPQLPIQLPDQCNASKSGNNVMKNPPMYKPFNHVFSRTTTQWRRTMHTVFHRTVFTVEMDYAHCMPENCVNILTCVLEIRNKLRADRSHKMLVIIRCRIFCLPVCYPKIYIWSIQNYNFACCFVWM